MLLLSSSSGFILQQHIIVFPLLFLLLPFFPSPSALFPINSGRPSSSDPSILITVKTTMANHRSRVEDAMATWASTAERKGEDKTQILFISDSLPSADQQSPSPLIQPTKCLPGHTNAALCCKMAFELRMALQLLPDFWCHFDDDNFLLLDNLRSFLRQFHSHDDLYLGRPSTSGPVVLPQLDEHPELLVPFRYRKRAFWFGTGGAGLCLSRSTLRKLNSFVSGEINHQEKQFQWICAKLGVPDDVTIGFILENLLGISLTPTDRFHSHLDRVDAIPPSQLIEQISLSGSTKDGNLVNVPEKFRRSAAENSDSDLLRFRSLYKFISERRKKKEIRDEKLQ